MVKDWFKGNDDIYNIEDSPPKKEEYEEEPTGEEYIKDDEDYEDDEDEDYEEEPIKRKPRIKGLQTYSSNSTSSESSVFNFIPIFAGFIGIAVVGIIGWMVFQQITTIIDFDSLSVADTGSNVTGESTGFISTMFGTPSILVFMTIPLIMIGLFVMRGFTRALR